MVPLVHQIVPVVLISSIAKIQKYKNAKIQNNLISPNCRLPLVHQNVLVVLYSSIAIFGITANTAILFAFFRNKANPFDGI